MKLKICGMKNENNILDVAELNPGYMGFIFYEKSPRHFNTTIPELPESIKKIGVFVNATFDFIRGKVEKHDLQGVQLHGDETPELCKSLKDLGIIVIKVFSIKNQFNFKVLEPFEDVCDYYLFDTKGKEPGGNGYTFNWNVLKKYPSIKPYFLSGGIGPKEMDSLLLFLKRPESEFCAAVDLNSKFETAAGLKNTAKLKTFQQKLIDTNYLR
ncbi:phosphoribosylanthranilate isomerase [Lacinutrix sp. MedPE-SW]|uniref:phosphoribosylanthranilate isomerase n=1 Tax=Lacinutrix sp. MedPE-SW TaxID=1860087 RepID=UPI000913CC51|nr:phosphoribosylanthranilate isomerase [Lacinutrix sp. MedPE-SW]OIQ18786.1 MAG: N-(5'-phosphoribosyl)anthranilate isomerase [Lacinutrix sp. MedPE-SW]